MTFFVLRRDDVFADNITLWLSPANGDTTCRKHAAKFDTADQAIKRISGVIASLQERIDELKQYKVELLVKE